MPNPEVGITELEKGLLPLDPQPKLNRSRKMRNWQPLPNQLEKKRKGKKGKGGQGRKGEGRGGGEEKGGEEEGEVLVTVKGDQLGRGAMS